MTQYHGKSDPSPCFSCTRVKDPRDCENKNCRSWQQWFLGRWEQIYAYGRKLIDNMELKPVGVVVGGTPYAPPHRVRSYVQADPCEKCPFPRALCGEPCVLKRSWEQTRKDVLL